MIEENSPTYNVPMPKRFTLHELDTEVDGTREIRIVAMWGQTLVGTIGLGFLHRRSACIRQLFVHKQFRNQGVGSLLVNRCCEIAKDGCENVGLNLDITNGETEAFYKKLGFKFAYQYSDQYLLVKEL